MARPRENKLSLYARKGWWYVSARDPLSGKALTMSLRENNPALAAVQHEDLQAAWRRGEKIFPQQAEHTAMAADIRLAIKNYCRWRSGQVVPQ